MSPILALKILPHSGQVVTDGKSSFGFILFPSNPAHLLGSKVAVPSRLIIHQSFLSLALVS